MNGLFGYGYVGKEQAKDIEIKDAVLFDVSAATLTNLGSISFSAYAVLLQKGSFVYLEIRRGDDVETAEKYVERNPFPALSEVVEKYGLKAFNGNKYYVEGLSRNLGGRVKIVYSSGETLEFFDNRAPVLSAEAIDEIISVLKNALSGQEIDKFSLADVERIILEADDDEVKTKVVADVLDCGIKREMTTGCFGKERRDVFEISQKKYEKINKLLKLHPVACYCGFPLSYMKRFEDSNLVFILKDGRRFEMNSDIKPPVCMSGVLFELTIELTTK